MPSGEKIIGIDLGTTNSVVAVMEGKEVKVIPNAEGNRLTPSVVAFTDKGETIVGEPARRQAVTNPTRTVYSIKRFMGRRHNEVATEEKMVPYKVVGGPEDYVKVRVDNHDYTPPEISAFILRKLKEAAEAYLGHKVNKAVITVPAYFNDAQRQATKDAGQIAGLEVARIINEPTAASLAYGLDKKKNEKIVVFDLGGGTFDVSVLEVADGVFRVISTNGDTHLGGDDFDQTMINYVADEFKKQYGIDLRKDTMALQRLQEACEKAKKELSSAQSTDINLPFITADASGPKHLQMNITRAKLEQLIDHLIDRCRGPVQQAMKDAHLTPKDIDEVVLVGGSTRVPEGAAGRQGDVRRQGAAQGRQPRRSRGRGRRHPGRRFGRRRARRAAVGRDAAVAGHRNPGRHHDQARREEHHHSHRAEADFQHGRRQPDGRHGQGLSGRAADGRRQPAVGHVQPGRPSAGARGMPQIEVKFDIDANGILNVSAKDLGTGKEQTVRIEQSSGISDDEIEKMRKDADSHAEEDKRKRAMAEQRNQADSMCWQLEKLIKEHEAKLKPADKEAVSKAIEKTREAAKGDDLDRIKAAVHELEQASHALSKTLYEKAGAQAAGAAPAPRPGRVLNPAPSPRPRPAATRTPSTPSSR